MKKYRWHIVAALIVLGALFVLPYYQRVWSPSVSIEGGGTVDFYIPTGANYSVVGEKLLRERLISNVKGFHSVAEWMNYPRHVGPGRYILKDGMSNRSLLKLLRSGEQAPVKVTFVKARVLDDFAEKIAPQLEFSKKELLETLNDKEWLWKEFKLRPSTVLGVILPNTFEFYWDKQHTPPRVLIEKMYAAYRKFWNETRESQRKRLGFSRMEVVTMASIVEEETNNAAEKQNVAGVYLNRIRSKMPLQADPTVKYAVGDFTLTRILNEHLEKDSRYNTYMYAGLPPGPICTPSAASIDAVLANKKHNFYYFCAKTDNSGTHHFSKNLTEHNRYAAKYHQMLNQRRRSN